MNAPADFDLHEQAEAYRQAEARAMYEDAWSSAPEPADAVPTWVLFIAAVGAVLLTIAVSAVWPGVWFAGWTDLLR